VHQSNHESCHHTDDVTHCRLLESMAVTSPRVVSTTSPRPAAGAVARIGTCNARPGKAHHWQAGCSWTCGALGSVGTVLEFRQTYEVEFSKTYETEFRQRMRRSMMCKECVGSFTCLACSVHCIRVIRSHACRRESLFTFSYASPFMPNSC
jgi:hypothetical protein